MYVPRASILRRPMRQEGGQANVENADREFEKEQARIAAKAARQASVEERLVGAFYASNEEKRRAWEVVQAEARHLSQAKAEAEWREHQREAEWLSQPQHVYVDSQRPYVANCSTYYMPREMEQEARRRAQREADELNRRMQQVRSLTEQQHRAAEQAAVRSTMQTEDTWFNRGATSDRWVPPEHRVHRRAGVPPHLALAPAPYYCDDASTVASSSTSASISRSRGRPSSTGTTAPAHVAAHAAAAPSRPSTAPAAGVPRACAARLREGEGARAALSHDIAHASEASAHVRQQQARSSKQEMSHPWSWAT